MSNEFENAKDNIGNDISEGMADVASDAKGIKESIGSAAQGMAKEIKDNVGGTAQDMAKDIKDNVGGKAQDIARDVRDSAAAKKAQDFAQGVKDNVPGKAQDMAKGVRDTVAGKSQDMAKGVRDSVAVKSQEMAKGVKDNVTATKKKSTRRMVTIAMLAAVSIILSFFEIQIPIFPSFLKLDIADLPTVIAAIAFGPVGGILVTLIRNLVQLTRTTTGGVGDFANFVMACSLCIPLSLIYRKFKNFKGYVIGSIVGVIIMAGVACLLNYNILIPLFSTLFGAPIEAFVGMAQEFNSHVVDLKTLVLYSIGPFNLLKGAIIVIISYPLWKALKKVIKP